MIEFLTEFSKRATGQASPLAPQYGSFGTIMKSAPGNPIKPHVGVQKIIQSGIPRHLRDAPYTPSCFQFLSEGLSS